MKMVLVDTSLQDKLKTAADFNAVVAIAIDAGFVISTEVLKNAQSEMSDEELEGAAGGGHFFDEFGITENRYNPVCRSRI